MIWSAMASKSFSDMLQVLLEIGPGSMHDPLDGLNLDVENVSENLKLLIKHIV